jgi:hypothetical protein
MTRLRPHRTLLTLSRGVALIVFVTGCRADDDTGPVMAGCYSFGHEVNVFKPAGVDSLFWVTGPAGILAQLRHVHDSLTSEPYEKVWVRVAANRSSREPDGFARDYDGLIEVSRILEVRRPADGECR